MGIGHGHRTGLATRRNKADIAALANGIGNRQVMNRDDAVNSLNVVLLQRSGDGFADGYHFAHCSPFSQSHQ